MGLQDSKHHSSPTYALSAPPDVLVDKGKWHRGGTDLKRPLREKEKGRKSACPRVTYFLRIIEYFGEKSLNKSSQETNLD